MLRPLLSTIYKIELNETSVKQATSSKIDFNNVIVITDLFLISILWSNQHNDILIGVHSHMENVEMGLIFHPSGLRCGK